MSTFANFIEMVEMRTRATPDRTAFIILENGERESERVTFAQLDERARVIAANLQEVTRPGDRVLLLYPSGLNFIYAFLGCLYAAVVAVPAYPLRKNHPGQRLQGIVEDARPAIALTDKATRDDMHRAQTAISTRCSWSLLRLIRWQGTRSITSMARLKRSTAAGSQREERQIGRDALAMLQYTSGSTGTPKGLMINHGNICAVFD
jgi:acyl-CoA synthetase (AMP-forming)/AMP-acid ligase II